jgi:hypothetical protein
VTGVGRHLARLAVLLALVAVVDSGASGATRAPKFELLAHVDPGLAYAADVWGHGSYAYLSSHRARGGCEAAGVLVYDLHDARHPRRVARFGRYPGTWTEKTIVEHVATPALTGELAVTSLQSCPGTARHGFALVDVTHPAAPDQLAFVQTEPRGSHEIWLHAVGDRAYVYTAIVDSEIESAADFDPQTHRASAPGRPDFRIFDVSDPRAPREVGSWGAWRTLAINPNEGIGEGRYRQNLVHSVITNAAGTLAFLSYWDLGTVILDIRDPTSPRYLGRTEFGPGELGNAHSAWLADGERILLETHETDGGYPTIWDVSDPKAPKRLGELKVPDRLHAEAHRGVASGAFDSVHDPKALGRTAYFSWYDEGVVAADLSNPARPRVVARFLPTPNADPESLLCPGKRCRTVWGVYPTARYVLASDMGSGLWVLRLWR